MEGFDKAPQRITVPSALLRIPNVLKKRRKRILIIKEKTTADAKKRVYKMKLLLRSI
jgi:hypothetical protein